MKKKLLMLALMGVFATATLTGCGDKDNADTKSEEEKDDDKDEEKDDDKDEDRDADVPSRSAGSSDSYDYGIDEEEYLDQILGNWIEDEEDPLLLSIYCESGIYAYDCYTVDGELLDYGTLEMTYEEHPDDSVSLWYTLTSSDGYEFVSFPVDLDDDYPMDLYTGQDGTGHFVRDDGSYDSENQGGEGDISPYFFLGVWQCDEFTMEILDNNNGTYFVDIVYAASEDEVYEWNYICDYDYENEMLWCEEGELWDLFFTDGELVSKNCEYGDGSAIFYFYDGNLIWQDHVDNSDLAFVYIGE